MRLNGRFPLYQVIMALGRDPTDSHGTSYLRSATNGVGGDIIFALSGFTSMSNGQEVNFQKANAEERSSRPSQVYRHGNKKERGIFHIISFRLSLYEIIMKEYERR